MENIYDILGKLFLFITKETPLNKKLSEFFNKHKANEETLILSLVKGYLEVTVFNDLSPESFLNRFNAYLLKSEDKDKESVLLKALEGKTNELVTFFKKINETYFKRKMTLKDFFTKGNVIHPGSYENAKKLLEAFDKCGKKWVTGDSYLSKDRYEMFGDKTCYDNEGKVCSLDYYKNTPGYNVLEFDEIDLEDLKEKENGK